MPSDDDSRNVLNFYDTSEPGILEIGSVSEKQKNKTKCKQLFFLYIYI